ncbi:hypothetical protein SADUNF_Sadunf08G0025500 [Salix dunnii]|uniref:Uncharacterized protein n=1 Tax=Salix dunnii TaxID=1413687 RepID=A0A835JX28_9ROSI|nr:hypothetical protein SADUNF_Sadunf08G0025500 [Salix dunnii]
MKWKRFLLIPVLRAAVPLQQEPLNNAISTLIAGPSSSRSFLRAQISKRTGFQRKDSHEDIFFVSRMGLCQLHEGIRAAWLARNPDRWLKFNESDRESNVGKTWQESQDPNPPAAI